MNLPKFQMLALNQNEDYKMNKSELIDHIAQEHSCTKADA